MEKFAFLTGINEYGMLPRLKWARQDAEAIAEALRKNYQFVEIEITLMTDQQKGYLMPMTTRIIEARLQELENTNPELFIFGFWGHGFFQDQLYFCPMGVSKEEVTQNGLPMSRLKELIGRIGAKNVFLILDCCQSEATRVEIQQTMTKDAEISLINAARDIKLCLQQNHSRFEPNIAILNSCSVGQCAYEWDEREHGIFTAHLLDAFNERLDSVSRIVYQLDKLISTTARQFGHEQILSLQHQGNIDLPVMEMKDGKLFERLPDRAEQIQILKPTIDDLKITFVPIGSSDAQPLDSNVTELSPISAELAQLRSEEAGIDEIIERLTSRRHKALEPAQLAIQRVEAQLNSLKRKKAETWKAFEQTGGDVQKLEERIARKPKEKARRLKMLCPQRLIETEFIDLVMWGQRCFLAEQEFERVQSEYKQKYTKKLQELLGIKKKIKKRQQTCLDPLQKSAVMAILATLPGYERLSATLPESELNQLLPEITKNNLDWKISDLKDLAESLWNSNRPVVVKELEQKEKEKREKWEEEESKKKSKQKRQLSINRTMGGLLGAALGVVLGFILMELLDLNSWGIRETSLCKLKIFNLLFWASFVSCVGANFMSKMRIAVTKNLQDTDFTELNTPALLAGELRVFRICGVDYAFHWCPAGEFMMGSPQSEKGRQKDEKQHKVRISKVFWM